MRATVGLFVVGFALLSGTACEIGAGDGNAERQDGAIEFGGTAPADFNVVVTLLTPPPLVATAGVTYLEYYIVVKNDGETEGTTVVEAALPTGFQLVNWDCSGCAAPVSGTGSLSKSVTLSPGEGLAFNVDVFVQSNATGVNSIVATVSAEDPPAGNEDNTHTSVGVTVLREVDVDLAYSDGVDTADAGDTLVYTLTVDNEGPSDAVSVEVSDNVVDGPFDTVSWTCAAEGGSTCPATSGIGSVAATIPSLPAGSALVYTITAVLDPTFEGVVLTQADVDGPDLAAPVFVTDETTVLGDESCLPETLTVVATRYYAPTVWVDGEATLCETASIEIPAELPVTWGNASKHAAWLDVGEVRCEYRGNATVPHPTTAAQGGDAYAFRSCDDGSQPGDSLEGDTVRVHVHNGDQKAPYGTPPHDNSTEVTVTLSIGG